jgi:tRNA(Ile)-lysidine synthase
LAQQADEAHAVLAEQAAELLHRAERPRAGDTVILDRETLRASHRYLIGEVLRLLWEREGWPMGEMTADHWHRVAEIAHGERAAADFPGGVSTRCAGRVVQIGRGS